MKTRLHLSVSLVVAAVLLGVAYSAASAKDSDAKAAARGTVKKEKKTRQFRGRLPNYFRTVVTEQQRQKIYTIQKEYSPQIRKLKAQLKALMQERNAKIDAVLSPEQRKQIAELKEAAKEKRKKGKKKDKKKGLGHKAAEDKSKS